MLSIVLQGKRAIFFLISIFCVVKQALLCLITPTDVRKPRLSAPRDSMSPYIANKATPTLHAVLVTDQLISKNYAKVSKIRMLADFIREMILLVHSLDCFNLYQEQNRLGFYSHRGMVLGERGVRPRLNQVPLNLLILLHDAFANLFSIIKHLYSKRG